MSDEAIRTKLISELLEILAVRSAPIVLLDKIVDWHLSAVAARDTEIEALETAVEHLTAEKLEEAAEIEALRAANQRISDAWAEVIQREQRTENSHLYDTEKLESEIEALRVSRDRWKFEAREVGGYARETADTLAQALGYAGAQHAGLPLGSIGVARLAVDRIAQLARKVAAVEALCDKFGLDVYPSANTDDMPDRAVLVEDIRRALAGGE